MLDQTSPAAWQSTDLLQTNQLLQNMIDASDGCIAYCEAIWEQTRVCDFVYRLANRAMYALAGQPAGQLLGARMLTLFPSVKETGLFERYARVVETGEGEEFDVSYPADGYDGWYRITARPLSRGLVLSFVDITARKQAEQEQQKQADFLTLLLQTSPGGIIAYEAIRQPISPSADAGETKPIQDFRPIFFNIAYEQIFGESADSIQNNTFRQRFDQDDLFEFYVQLTETGQAVRREHYYPHLTKWLDIAGAKLPDGFLVVVNDITARKLAEQQRQQQADALEQANRQLARSNDNLQQFAYVASHDLQEPLRKIRSFGSMLQERYAPLLDEQGVDMIDRMKQAATRMSVLISDLLDYSRLTTQPPVAQPQNLRTIVDGVLTTLELLVTEKRAVIDVDDLGTVSGDATQLAQLFQNLLTNALKFTGTDESGALVPPHVRIHSRLVGRADLPPAYQPADSLSAYRLIQVSDNGIGFNPHQAELIFGAFQRLHNRSQYPGTGIGLAIVKKVVDNHRGYVVADSQPGRGATFTIYLPAGDSTSGATNGNDEQAGL